MLWSIAIRKALAVVAVLALLCLVLQLGERAIPLLAAALAGGTVVLVAVRVSNWRRARLVRRLRGW